MISQSGSIYIQSRLGIKPFVWQGRITQIQDVESPYREVTLTESFSMYGGTQIDGSLRGVALPVESSITLTEEHKSHFRSMLRGKFFNIDKRIYLNNKDRESHYKWLSIERIIMAQLTGRNTFATTESEEVEAVLSMPLSGHHSVDIYRTVFNMTSIMDLQVPIVDVTVATPPKGNTEGLLYAVSGVNLSHPEVSLLINEYGGDLGEWNISTLDGVTDTPVSVVGFNSFVAILFDSYMLRSDKRGMHTQTVTPTDWSGMTSIFGKSQTMMFAVGDNGNISRSINGGRSWYIQRPTTANLLGGHIVDEVVVYVYGENGTLLRSDDAGNNWYEINTNTVLSILSLASHGREGFIFVDSDGVLHESNDSGRHVKAQSELEHVIQGGYTNAFIEHIDDSGVFFANIGNTTYRNVEFGASDYWYVPDDATNKSVMSSGVVLDCNTVIMVGGSENASLVALLS